jgi:hypothetical protein
MQVLKEATDLLDERNNLETRIRECAFLERTHEAH